MNKYLLSLLGFVMTCGLMTQASAEDDYMAVDEEPADVPADDAQPSVSTPQSSKKQVPADVSPDHQF
ncbi:MAG: hypothetical protein FJZ58_01460 [Chlamydiae bacterium]|nr:hypothetical protein [Chlamydiota bacterium]